MSAGRSGSMGDILAAPSPADSQGRYAAQDTIEAVDRLSRHLRDHFRQQQQTALEDRASAQITRTSAVLVAMITVAGLLTTSTYPGLYTAVPTGQYNGTFISSASLFHDPTLEQ